MGDLLPPTTNHRSGRKKIWHWVSVSVRKGTNESRKEFCEGSTFKPSYVTVSADAPAGTILITAAEDEKYERKVPLKVRLVYTNLVCAETETAVMWSSTGETGAAQVRPKQLGCIDDGRSSSSYETSLDRAETC